MSDKKIEHQKVRFWWCSWKGGYVRLNVRKGKTLASFQDGRTSDGFHWDRVKFSFDGSHLLEEGRTSGQDCDGPYRHGYLRQCRVDRLAVVPTVDPATLRPDWEECLPLQVIANDYGFISKDQIWARRA